MTMSILGVCVSVYCGQVSVYMRLRLCILQILKWRSVSPSGSNGRKRAENKDIAGESAGVLLKVCNLRMFGTKTKQLCVQVM